MSTRTHIDIYEDIARLGESVKEEEKLGWKKIQEAWVELQRHCNEKTINFGKYLTDTAMTVDYLVNECCKPGAFSLLVAPCDSGKTKTMLEEFASAVSGKYNVVITTPTTLQSEQNAQMYKSVGPNGMEYPTIPVTGASRKTFHFDQANAYSAVFDSIARLEQMPDEELRHVVLIIDEAHQMEDAKEYRDPTINVLWRVINRTKRAGGCVIFMTGTAAKILALPFDNRATFVKGEVNFGRDSASLMRPKLDHNYKKIEVIRKDSHEFNMAELIASTMSKLIFEGKIPFVRINDKNMIATVAHALAMEGKKITTLTADDKGCKIVETEHGREITYDSPIYASIMKNGLLEDSDGFIFTSMLEVGTSIKGIKHEDGTVSQPEEIVPIYACLNPTDCDTDAMEQFFARLRFSYEKAMVLMNTPKERKYSSEQINFERIAGALYNMAQNHADVMNRDRSAAHLDITRINRRSETELIRYNGMQYVVDINSVLARAYVLQDMIINLFPGETVGMLEERFGVPVTQSVVTGTAPYNFNANRDLPESLLNEIENIKNGTSICSLEALKEVMTNPMGGQYSADILEPLRKSGHESENPEDESIGMTLIRAALPYFACGIYSAADCLDMAAQKVSRPHAKLVSPSTDQPVNLSLDKQHGLFQVISHFTIVEQDYLMTAYEASHNSDSKILAKYNYVNPLRMFNGETQYILSNNMDSPMLADFMTLMRKYRNVINWRKTCLGAMMMTEEDFHAYVQSVTFAKWNKLAYDSQEYNMAVMPGTSVTGTEYDILRDPRHTFHYFDEETAKRLEQDPDYMNSDEFPGEFYWFCDGLIGATLTPYDIRNMAKCICPEINRRCRAAHAHYVYKPEQLYYALKSIYTVDEQMTPDGPSLTIKGLRQRAIKFMAPKMDAIDDIRYDLFHKIDEIVIDGRIRLDEKRKKINRILHEGMGTGCFDRRFVDRFSDELNKLQALCGRTYRFNYEVGMTLAFYMMMQNQPELPCTLQEIVETEFGTKNVTANPAALEIKEKITEFLKPSTKGMTIKEDELWNLKPMSMQIESLVPALNLRNEMMLFAKRVSEDYIAGEQISIVCKNGTRMAVYDKDCISKASELPEKAAQTNVSDILGDQMIIDAYTWYTWYIRGYERTYPDKAANKLAKIAV